MSASDIKELTKQLKDIALKISDIQSSIDNQKTVDVTSLVITTKAKTAKPAKTPVEKSIKPAKMLTKTDEKLKAKNSVGKSAEDVNKSMYRPSFFKMIFMENLKKYQDILWTQEEIDAAFELPEVSSKRTFEERYAKIARVIYDTAIKADNPPGRKAEFEKIFAEFKG